MQLAGTRDGCQTGRERREWREVRKVGEGRWKYIEDLIRFNKGGTQWTEWIVMMNMNSYN